jgi:hypothetical protein
MSKLIWSTKGSVLDIACSRGEIASRARLTTGIKPSPPLSSSRLGRLHFRNPFHGNCIPVPTFSRLTLHSWKRDAAGLRATIAALPTQYRETVILRDVQGLSYREISGVTGVPTGTAMSRAGLSITIPAKGAKLN